MIALKRLLRIWKKKRRHVEERLRDTKISKFNIYVTVFPGRK